MSRIGRQPVEISQGVKIEVIDSMIVVTGRKGTLQYPLRKEVELKEEEGKIYISRTADTKNARAMHGTYRSLVSNMIVGVTEGWKKVLEINGTGYRAALNGNSLTLNVGFSHQVIIEAPKGVTFEVNANKITVQGIDKALVGETAARVRKIKPPDPYKAKGIKYIDEVVRRKAGKAAKAAA